MEERNNLTNNNINKSKKNLNIIDKTYSKENKRNYGIDLLKIFSVINIIIIHINKFSHQLSLNYNNRKYMSIWLLEVMGYWAVNGFGLISGIVGYKKYKFSNLIYIWFLSSFYSIIISLYLYYDNKITLKHLFLSILPILLKRNWYLNAYFCMYLLLPFINYGIMNLNRKTYKNIIMFFFLFYSIYHIIGAILVNERNNFHFLNDGYSSSWLTILYIVGGYFGKYIFIDEINITLKNWIFWVLIYFVSSYFTLKIYVKLKSDLFISYLSPSMILQAISLIMIFSKLNFKRKWITKIISFLSQFTFNVIFIHLRLFLPDIKIKILFFKWVDELSPNMIFFKIYGLGILIYAICSIIDYFRVLLFSLLKIRQLCIYIENIFVLLFDLVKF